MKIKRRSTTTTRCKRAVRAEYIESVLLLLLLVEEKGGEEEGVIRPRETKQE